MSYNQAWLNRLNDSRDSFNSESSSISGSILKAAVTIAVIGAGIKATTTILGYIKKKKRIQNSLNKPNIVILHQFPRGTTVPNFSPFPLKLETYLRLAKIPYENDYSTPLGPKGKCPFITLNGEDISDSQIIMEHLNKVYNVDLDKNLSEIEKAIGHAIRIMIENHSYWCGAYYRYVLDETKVGKRQMNFPYPLNFFAFSIIRRTIKRESWYQGIGRHSKYEIMALLHKDLKSISQYMVLYRYIYDRCKSIKKVLQGAKLLKFALINFAPISMKIAAYYHGMGRHTRVQVHQMAQKDLIGLAHFLGDKKFLFGNEITETDCAVFGMLAQIMWTLPGTALEEFFLGECPNLKDYCLRMKEQVWPDWDKCLYPKK